MRHSCRCLQLKSVKSLTMPPLLCSSKCCTSTPGPGTWTSIWAVACLARRCSIPPAEQSPCQVGPPLLRTPPFSIIRRAPVGMSMLVAVLVPTPLPGPGIHTWRRYCNCSVRPPPGYGGAAGLGLRRNPARAGTAGLGVGAHVHAGPYRRTAGTGPDPGGGFGVHVLATGGVLFGSGLAHSRAGAGGGGEPLRLANPAQRRWDMQCGRGFAYTQHSTRGATGGPGVRMRAFAGYAHGAQS